MTSCIYIIECNDNNIIENYVGSTTNLDNRIIMHKTRFNNNKNSNKPQFHYKLYKFMRENGGFNNFRFIKLETINNEDKKYRLEREKYWIKLNNSKLNSLIPTRTHKEWLEDNSEKRKEYKKMYRQEKVICECGKEITKNNLLRHKKNNCKITDHK